ncbi:hypothetical protein BB8028_0002g07250 [Beauveria bassiana]|uniref:Secreted protein n=1 Tax=Beauveria bassiana TaxID=176275 RepID=A0A2S7Y387_BEABA|nr:hypothetical protein BB8028_0002g07250 [Beauveria bassiana]
MTLTVHLLLLISSLSLIHHSSKPNIIRRDHYNLQHTTPTQWHRCPHHHHHHHTRSSRERYHPYGARTWQRTNTRRPPCALPSLPSRCSSSRCSWAQAAAGKSATEAAPSDDASASAVETWPTRARPDFDCVRRIV